MAQAGSEGKFALRDIERRLRIAQSLIVEPRDIFERCVAHCRVITIDIESAHQLTMCGKARDSSKVKARNSIKRGMIAREAGDSIKPGRKPQDQSNRNAIEPAQRAAALSPAA